MARKVINYDNWVQTRALVEARAKRILAFFDPSRMPKHPSEDHAEVAFGDGSDYEPQAGDEP